MRSRRRKRRSFGPLLAVVFLLLLIAGAAAGFVIGRRYMPGKEMADKAELFHIKGSQVAILLNNELQEEKGIYEDGQVYLPISWVNEYVNERFYWDETEKLLVYALPEEIVYADESDMGEQGPLLKVKEGEAYLSLGLIMNYSDQTCIYRHGMGDCKNRSGPQKKYPQGKGRNQERHHYRAF